MGGGCRLGRHSWNGCVCEVCGKHRDSNHDYVVIERKVVEPDSCCWDPGEPCTGPLCGTHCDSFYPGKAGSETITERCTVCGQIRKTSHEGIEH